MKGNMRGEILKKALEVFRYGAEAFVGIAIEPFFVFQRGSAAEQLERLISGTVNRGLEKRRDPQYYHNLLARLRRDGLVVAQQKEDALLFRLTRKGMLKLKALLKQGDGEKMPQRLRYKKEMSSTVTIVTFDIPERNRRKRDWLRSALKNLTFQMLQKSVWIGKVKIPEAFLEDLRGFGIIDRVEILGVTKSGTLKRLS